MFIPPFLVFVFLHLPSHLLRIITPFRLLQSGVIRYRRVAWTGRLGWPIHSLPAILGVVILWLEVNRRFVTAVHVERHRHVLMRDQPLAVDLAAASGHPHPDNPG